MPTKPSDRRLVVRPVRQMMPGPRQTALPPKEPAHLELQNAAALDAGREDRSARGVSTRAASGGQPASTYDRVPVASSAVASAATAMHPHPHQHSRQHSNPNSYNVSAGGNERHLHQRSQPQARIRYSPLQTTAPRAAGSPSASPPRRRYQRHHPYTQSTDAASFSPSPPLLAESISTPSVAAASTHPNAIPHAEAERSSSSGTRPHRVHTHTHQQQSVAAANSPYSLVAQSSMTGANSYLHGAHRMPAAYPDTRPAGAYDQQCGQQRTTSFRSHIPQYHSGHNHHHYHHHNSYGMPASVPASTPASMAASAAAGHLYPSNVAGFAHGDAASSLYLHPGDTSLSASTSPVVPPEARPIHGSSRPLTAEEKELKRKVSHSAIEKRRRERTNAVLRELQQIVPGLSKPGKIQKLEILEAAADYIRQLTADPNANQDTHAKSAQRCPSHHQHQHQQQFLFHSQCRDQAHRQHAHQQQWPEQIQESVQVPVPAPVSMPMSASVRMNVHADAPDLEQMTSSRLVADVSADRAALGRSPGAPQHTAIATPMSECSNASASDSADEVPLIADSTRLIAAATSAAEDPSSMKVNFLLC